MLSSGVVVVAEPLSSFVRLVGVGVWEGSSEVCSSPPSVLVEVGLASEFDCEGVRSVV